MNSKKIADTRMKEMKTLWPVGDFRDKAFYADWLAQTYHFVTHSTALLGFALPHLRDPKLRQIFEHHLGEESRHDLLAKKDLENLGFTTGSFPASPFTEAFYHSQYFRIQFESGSALLGYILFLEGLAVTLGKDVYEEVKEVHKSSVSFLRVHAEEDVSHVARAVSLISSLPEAEQKLIWNNFDASSALYSTMLKEISRALQKKCA